MPAHMLTRTNVSKSRVLKVLSSPEEEEQEEEEEEEKKPKKKQQLPVFHHVPSRHVCHGRSSFMTRK